MTTFFIDFPSRILDVAAIRNLIVGLAMFAALVSPVMASDQIAAVSPHTPKEIFCNSDGECAIRNEKLSNQQSDPFLILGEIVDGSHPRYSEYKKPINKFQNVVRCLTDPEQSAQKPNLLNVDWPNLRNQDDLEVCLFRIFRSLPSQDSIRAWLEFHEFEVHGPVKRFSENYVATFKREPVFRISGNWSSEETMKHRPSLLWRFTGRTLVHGTSVFVGLSENGEVVGIGITAIIE